MKQHKMRYQIVGAVALTLAGLVGTSGVAMAAPNIILTPGAASPGTTVSVTVDQYGPCNNGITPPPPGSPFDSTIELFDGSHTLISTGSFPGGTSVGTLPIPFATPPGPYTVEVSCAVSLGNGIFFPNNPLTILLPVLIDLPPGFAAPIGGGGGGGAAVPETTGGEVVLPASTPALRPVPVQAVPNVTG